MADNRQFQRTCGACGKVWYVSPEDLKGPGFGELFDAGFGFGKVHKRSVAVRKLHRDKAEQVKSHGRCPSCGYAKYTEQRV